MKKQHTPSSKGHSKQPAHKKPTHHAPSTKKTFTGTLLVSPRGFGNVRLDGQKDLVSIDPSDLNTGLHGDIVEMVMNPKKKHYDTGKIVSIVSRAKSGFAGTLFQKDGGYAVKTDEPRMYRDILIPKEAVGVAQVGEKVFATITEWNDPAKEPIGAITKVLGKVGENNAEMLGIALERGFDQDFPPLVAAEADAIQAHGITDEEKAGRRDMRQIPTCTIDPVDAKDFDDALSIQTLTNGDYEIGIHIADVSHYVRPGTAIDREAFNRGTSVYLVDRTIPMLPEALSNDLCSLKPNVDRLAMSAIIVLDKDANVKDTWYGKTVIHSAKRFSYEEAQGVLDAGEGTLYDELIILNTLAKKILAKREAAGTLILETDEVKFELDADGVPLRAYRKVRGDTHKLIEEFMLLANRKVAEVFKAEEKKDGIGIYRIHDLPNEEKIADFAYLIEKLGYTFPKGKMHPKLFKDLLVELKDAPEKDMLTSVLIRSMAKAVYSTKNVGHFGLGFEDYTHFTSPIRRYPDLMVHRMLQAILTHHSITSKDQKAYERMSLHSSERERNAAEAERASVKYKQVEYMQTRVGEIYSGVITGVSERGLFVEELETKSEGMIQLRDLGDDFFTLMEKDLSVVGKNTKKRYRVGDEIKIKVMKADLATKTIDYALA